MALPETDPYKQDDPEIIVALSSSLGGRDYKIRAEIEQLCAYATFMLEQPTTGIQYKYPDEANLMGAYYLDASGAYVFLGWSVDPPQTVPGTQTFLTVYNPIWYYEESAAHIILAMAHYHCGILEAEIDVDSFDDTHDFLVLNSATKQGAALCNRSCLELAVGLMVGQHGIFLYINGDNKLAMDHIEHDPETTADWTIEEDDLLSVFSFGTIRDRKIPRTQTVGLDRRDISPGFPRAGVWEFEYFAAAWTDKELILEEALVLDMTGTKLGIIHTEFHDYIKMEIELGPLAHLFAINDRVKVDLPQFGMCYDEEVDDIFRVHLLELDLEDMTGVVTLLKHLDWGT